MTTIKLHYVRRVRGKLFWAPTPEMRAAGFLAKPLGPDGPAAQQEALRLYETWVKARTVAAEPTYPPGSLGRFWESMKGAADKPSAWWTAKEPRTREDYERAWVHMGAWRPGPGRPLLTHTGVSAVTTELCEAFFAHLEATVSPRERWRAIKGFKILLSEAVVRLRLPYASPASKLVNPQPKGRSAIWLGAEIEILATKALEQGYAGMAVAIRVAWDTMFSPADVWMTTRGELQQDATGWFIVTDRLKTGRDTYGALSTATAATVMTYIAGLGVVLGPDARVIRQRNGQAYRSKDTFGDDFRAVRLAAFGEDEKRQFMDIRRSANVEADAAGADKATMGELLANGIADSKFLEETYTPPTIAKARDVHLQRLEGRRKLAGEMTRLRCK